MQAQQVNYYRYDDDMHRFERSTRPDEAYRVTWEEAQRIQQQAQE